MSGPPATAGGGWLRLLRPGQWSKNLLVLAAPLAAGSLLDWSVLQNTLLALVAFVLASAAGYAVNDVADAELDRHHAQKRHRPVAAGVIAPGRAIAGAVVLFAAAVGVAALTASSALVAVVVAYVALTVSYSLGIKHVPVVEMAWVAAGFLLRAVAGGAAAEIPISQWFLIVASFGSLFIVAGKRFSELVSPSDQTAAARPLLSHYSANYLRSVSTIAAGVTITAYCLWAFEVGDQGSSTWARLSVAPLVLGLLRYARDVDAGRAEAPERIAADDLVLQLLGLAWLATFALAAFDV